MGIRPAITLIPNIGDVQNASIIHMAVLLCIFLSSLSGYMSSAFFFFFFKSTIYYMGCDGSPCLQEELCMEYQYSNLFYVVTQHKGLLKN